MIATPLSAEPGEEPVSFVSRQDLGRKGIETRRRLMNAARGLLDVTSPIAVTVAAIARAAGTSTGTFYVYFDDVNDIVLALAQEASADLGAVHEALEAWHGGLSADAGAERFVRSFRAYYDAHRAILSIRNMEGDRGDERFAGVRADAARPILTSLAELIERGALPPLSNEEALSRAIVIYAAIERLAATERANRPAPCPSAEGVASAEIAMLAELVDPAISARRLPRS